MGTHPNGQAVIVDPVVSAVTPTLQSLIASNPAAHLGEKTASRFQGQLPFLFKVLSVRTALSIQAHPDKALAARLHAAQPGLYKDANHKPEMAIATTDFEALCGFRPLRDIVEILEALQPDINGVLDVAVVQRAREVVNSGGDRKQSLREILEAVMRCPEDRVHRTLDAVVARLSNPAEQWPAAIEDVKAPFFQILQDFPGDAGSLCVFLLNYLKLAPGQAVYLGANEPHAYLSGGTPSPLTTPPFLSCTFLAAPLFAPR